MARNKTRTQRRVFVDNSILITALLSSQGGSFYILTQLHEEFTFCINEYVLGEVQDVLKRKFPSKNLINNLFLLLGLAQVEIVPNPSQSVLGRLNKLIEQEDTPILASALSNCGYLLTFDNDFLKKEVKEYARKRKMAIMTPREFLSHRA